MEVNWVDINKNGVVDGGEKGALKIANSWGTDEVSEIIRNGQVVYTWYSNDGFTWLSYDALNKASSVSGVPAQTERTYPWNESAGMNSTTYNRAYWITPKINYSPKMLVEYTVNHASRYDFKARLGFSSKNNNEPVAIWDCGGPNIYGTSAPISFDGTDTACDCTFVFDFTDLYDRYDNADGNWYVTFFEENFGNPALAKDIKITDKQSGKVYYPNMQFTNPFDFTNVSTDPINIKKNVSAVAGSILNTSMNSDRLSPTVASANSKIYAIGGYTGNYGNYQYLNTSTQLGYLK